MTVAERTRAGGYMLAVMFNLDAEIERRASDVTLFERMLGLRAGHGGGLASILWQEDSDPQAIMRLPASDEIKAVITDASDDEFEFVRRVMQITTIWTPVLLPLFLAGQGAKAKPFAALAHQFLSDVPVGLYPLLAVGLLVPLDAKEPDHNEPGRHLAAVAPGAVDTGLLRELPRETRQDAFAHLPEHRQEQIVHELRARPKPISSGYGLGFPSTVASPMTMGEIHGRQREETWPPPGRTDGRPWGELDGH